MKALLQNYLHNYFIDAVIAIACVSLAYAIFFAYHRQHQPIILRAAKLAKPPDTSCNPGDFKIYFRTDTPDIVWACIDGKLQKGTPIYQYDRARMKF